MTEAVLPTGPAGGHMFNFPEIGGNVAASAISQAYYPENRTAGAAVTKLGIQVGVDMASNVLKEFWPGSRAQTVAQAPCGRRRALKPLPAA